MPLSVTPNGYLPSRHPGRVNRNHFNHAASMVRAILAGDWTFDPPDWADSERFDASAAEYDHDSELSARYTRAVQTAEAFIILSQAFNPAFDSARFLQACGLVDAPSKARRKA